STAGPRSSTGLGVDPFAQPDLSQALETFGPREDLIRSLQRAADNAKSLWDQTKQADRWRRRLKRLLGDDDG
ncbi:MAG: hypothetical protein AAF108_05025, partial [Planctomycetota bacterium]